MILLIGAVGLLWPKELGTNREPRDPPIWAGILSGAGIGLLSGLTGAGGGIFLSPIWLFLGWSATKPASGVAAVFNPLQLDCGAARQRYGRESVAGRSPALALARPDGRDHRHYFGIRFAVPIVLKALGSS